MDGAEDAIVQPVRGIALPIGVYLATESQQKPHLQDATRISDNKPVYLKYVAKPSAEINIGNLFKDESLAKDPRNHSVPLLEVLEDPSDPMHAILVLPLLRRLDEPRPATVWDAMDLVDQCLEVRSLEHLSMKSVSSAFNPSGIGLSP